MPQTDFAWLDELLEDLDDIHAYDAAKAGPQEAIPFEQAEREIESLRVNHCGLIPRSLLRFLFAC